MTSDKDGNRDSNKKNDTVANDVDNCNYNDDVVGEKLRDQLKKRNVDMKVKKIKDRYRIGGRSVKLIVLNDNLGKQAKERHERQDKKNLLLFFAFFPLSLSIIDCLFRFFSLILNISCESWWRFCCF